MILSKTRNKYFRHLVDEVDLALFPSIGVSLLWVRENTELFNKHGIALEIRDIRGRFYDIN